MAAKKRPRDTVPCHDIRGMCKFVGRREALLRTGPHFVNRVLVPHLANTRCGVDGLLVDHTRSCCENEAGSSLSRRWHRFGLLALPQHSEIEAQRRHFESMVASNFKTIVPPLAYSQWMDSEGTMPGATATVFPITDVVLDMQEEFAVVCQRRRFSTYSTSDWEAALDSPLARHSTFPLVSVEPRWSTRLGFAFSALQFLSCSLRVIAGYYKAPVVDIFDLESVDEATGEPQQRFNLTDVTNKGIVEDDVVACANDVMPLNGDVSLGALSSGMSVWLDGRSGRAEVCTGAFTRQYNIGAQSRHTGRLSPLTCVASLCCGDPTAILLGTASGALQLWDVRYPRDYVAQHTTSATICRIHPSYSCPLRSAVWLNTMAGSIEVVCIGQRDMELIARRDYSDVQRSSSTFHLPQPQLCVMESSGIVACPHVSTGTLLLWDGKSVVRRRHASRVRSLSYNGNTLMNDSSCIDGGSDADLASRGEAFFPSEETDDCKIVLLNKLHPEPFSAVTACSVWARRDVFVCGDEAGAVHLL